MNKIICNINLFDLNQNIYLVNFETGEMDYLATASLDTIATTIATLSHKLTIFNIALHCNMELGTQLKQDIIEYSKTKYNISEHNLEIEVI